MEKKGDQKISKITLIIFEIDSDFEKEPAETQQKNRYSGVMSVLYARAMSKDVLGEYLGMCFFFLPPLHEVFMSLDFLHLSYAPRLTLSLCTRPQNITVFWKTNAAARKTFEKIGSRIALLG